MSKEKLQQEKEKIAGLRGPEFTMRDDEAIINVDNPPNVPLDFAEKNFDILAEIFLIIKDPKRSANLRIEYGLNGRGKETATVFFDNQQYYFTEEEREISNFHLWSDLAQKQLEANKKSSN